MNKDEIKPSFSNQDFEELRKRYVAYLISNFKHHQSKARDKEFMFELQNAGHTFTYDIEYDDFSKEIVMLFDFLYRSGGEINDIILLIEPIREKYIRKNTFTIKTEYYKNFLFPKTQIEKGYDVFDLDGKLVDSYIYDIDATFTNIWQFVKIKGQEQRLQFFYEKMHKKRSLLSKVYVPKRSLLYWGDATPRRIFKTLVKYMADFDFHNYLNSYIGNEKTNELINSTMVIPRDEKENPVKSSTTKYTNKRQALSLYYLILALDGLTATKNKANLTRLLHLLSGIDIPVKNYKEDIDNSTIYKSVKELFNTKKTIDWSESDLNYIIQIWQKFETPQSKLIKKMISLIEKDKEC